MKDPASYFTKESEVRSLIQTEVFEDWQSVQERHTVEYCRAMATATAGAFIAMREREEVRIQKESVELLAASLEKADQAEKAARASITYYKGEIESYRVQNDDKDIKFLMAVGCRMKDWTGTLADLKRLIGEKEKLLANLAAAVPGPTQRTPPPPPPPGGGGALRASA